MNESFERILIKFWVEQFLIRFYLSLCELYISKGPSPLELEVNIKIKLNSMSTTDKDMHEISLHWKLASCILMWLRLHEV
jgi:hypothetical protein